MVAALAVIVLLSSVPMFRIVNINFTPQDDQSEFDVSLRAPEGTSLEATEVTANRVASAIRQIPEVVYTMITVAGDSAGTLNTASLYVRLKPIDERDRDQFEIMDLVRNEVLPKSAPAGCEGVAAGARHRRRWRRRWSGRSGRCDVRAPGTRPAHARAGEQCAGREGALDPGSRGRRYVAARRQARDVCAVGSTQGG